LLISTVLGANMIRPSIRVVVGILIVLTSAVVIGCTNIPIAMQFQTNAMDFVFEALASTTDTVQLVIRRRSVHVELSCDLIYRASKKGTLVKDLFEFSEWAAPAALGLQIEASLFTADGRGVRVTSENTAGIPGPPIPGYVYITNLTAPGEYADIGQFEPTSHTPANATHPWTRFFTTLQWQRLPAVPDITNLTRSAPMQWAKLTPLQTIPGAQVQSALIIGGPVNAGTVTHSDDLQFLIIGIRSGLLAEYFDFPAVFRGKRGTVLMVDGVSGNYVTGNVHDTAGKVVNGSAQLLPLSELQDPRIASALAARVEEGASSEMYKSAASAFLTCTPPCSFTFWPHSDRLFVGRRRFAGLDVLIKPFTAVSVVYVSPNRGGAMDLRLIVLVHSEDVIDEFLSSMQKMLVGPGVLMLGVITVLLVLIGVWLFKDLTRVVEAMHLLAAIVATWGVGSVKNVSRESTADGLLSHESFFVEFQRAFRAISILQREMFTLRAFSAAALPSTSPNGSSVPRASSEHEGQQSSNTSCRPEKEMCIGRGSFATEIAATDVRLYHSVSGNLWRVPVTCVTARVHSNFMGDFKNLVEVQRRLSAAVLAVQSALAQCAGGFHLDDFVLGDLFFCHFNAVQRTPRHLLAALTFLSTCRSRLHAILEESSCRSRTTQPSHPPVLVAGVASSVGVCGVMGPKHLSTFTVVTPGASQSAFMCRVAYSNNILCALTWRAVEVGRMQQQAGVTQRRGAVHDIGTECPEYKFTPLMQVIQPGEAPLVSHAFSATCAVLTDSQMK
jgi:hypothetical protein